ncbi:hypothetical protein [Thalassotalea litorea]|uniref:hypothetical protein n=1 Tax=Thalassotalea litorea TaxID=2020715 RepID=UPI003736FE48
MFSTSREQFFAIALMLSGSYLIISSTEFMYHALGILALSLFFLLCLNSMQRIVNDSKRGKRSAIALRMHRCSFRYKTRLMVLAISLLSILESVRYFPENLAVAIALFAMILAIREWIALMQWLKTMQRRTMQRRTMQRRTIRH